MAMLIMQLGERLFNDVARTQPKWLSSVVHVIITLWQVCLSATELRRQLRSKFGSSVSVSPGRATQRRDIFQSMLLHNYMYTNNKNTGWLLGNYGR